MPNSRVYIDVEKPEGECDHHHAQHVRRGAEREGDELTERFVRGDASRNTEGSGLGLAIARSFTEAQKGSLHISVDGDLFKVVIPMEIDNCETLHQFFQLFKINKNIQDTLSLRVTRSGTKKPDTTYSCIRLLSTGGSPSVFHVFCQFFTIRFRFYEFRNCLILR